MILDSPSKFPRIENTHILVDVETTSFDPKREAFFPFLGDRVAGYAIGTLDGDRTDYVPVRHSKGGNCEFEPAIRFVREAIRTAKTITNHNIKFDAKFWRHDDIWDTCPLQDTMVLARLVHNDLISYRLDRLGEVFSGEKKLDQVKLYMDEIGSKDYGECPVELMGPYAEQDINLTRLLYHKLLTLLPESSKGIWKTETELCRVMLESEWRGIPIDEKAMRTASHRTLRRMLETCQELEDIAGFPVDPGKRSHITEVLTGQRGLKSATLTKKTKLPQWNATNLQALDDPVARKFELYSADSHFQSTFCEGWKKRIGTDKKVHCSFRIGGTGTGRLSSADPNTQNMPPEAEDFILGNPGEVLLCFDYSQIEYRIFGHYSNDETIVARYLADTATDFHQTLGDMLGVPRDFAKTLNFGFIYGMGKDKLLRSLVNVPMFKKYPEMEQALIAYAKKTDSYEALLKNGVALDQRYRPAAALIHSEYHRLFPTIQELQRRVQRKIRAAGHIRNYMGRVYRFPDGRMAYKALNYLCQGSAADIFKNRMVAVFEQFSGLKLLTNIHDSGWWTVNEDYLKENFSAIIRCMELIKPAMRIPLLVKGKVSRRSMARAIEVNGPEDIDAALEKSETYDPFD